MVTTSPAACDQVAVMDNEVTCAIMSEGVDRTEVVEIGEEGEMEW